MAGYSETPLGKKLGIKAGFRMLVGHAPTNYWDLVSPLPERVVVCKKRGANPLDFVHLFVIEYKTFQKEVLQSRKAIKRDGMIWISWPKKSSKVVTDLDENIIRDFALENGLVDIKVCAVDEVWSGLKLVIPVKERKTPS